MSKYAIRKCKSCGKEFEPKRKNQVNYKATCPKEQKMLFGGGIKRKGNTVTVSGAFNCYMYLKGFI